GDLFVQQKRSDGPQVEGIVKEVLDQALLVRPRELDAGFREKSPSERLHLIATLPLVHVLESREVELRDEGAVQTAPHLLEFVLLPSVPLRREELGCGGGGRCMPAAQAVVQAHRGVILPKRPLRGLGCAVGASRWINLPASAVMSRAAGASGSSRQSGRPAIMDVNV